MQPTQRANSTSCPRATTDWKINAAGTGLERLSLPSMICAGGVDQAKLVPRHGADQPI
jgi:hypothetical protein